MRRVLPILLFLLSCGPNKKKIKEQVDSLNSEMKIRQDSVQLYAGVEMLQDIERCGNRKADSLNNAFRLSASGSTDKEISEILKTTQPTLDFKRDSIFNELVVSRNKFRISIISHELDSLKSKIK